MAARGKKWARLGAFFISVLLCISLLFILTSSVIADDSNNPTKEKPKVPKRPSPEREPDKKKDPSKVRTSPDKENPETKKQKKTADRNLNLEVTRLNGRIGAFNLPYGGENVKTGTISITLGGKDQLPISTKTRVNPRLGKGRIVWPVRLSSPFLDEIGQGEIETFFIGTFTSVGNGGFVSVDVSNIVLPSGDITVININGNPPEDDDDDGDEEDPEEDPSKEITGAFYDLPESFINQYILPTLGQDINAALNMWNNVSRNDVNISPVLIQHAVESYQENSPNELVIYSATTNSYETADLTGNFSLKLWWDLDRMG